MSVGIQDQTARGKGRPAGSTNGHEWIDDTGRAIASLQSTTARTIVSLVVSGVDTSPGVVAATGIDRQLVHYHIGQLQAVGLLSFDPARRKSSLGGRPMRVLRVDGDRLLCLSEAIAGLAGGSTEPLDSFTVVPSAEGGGA